MLYGAQMIEKLQRKRKIENRKEIERRNQKKNVNEKINSPEASFSVYRPIKVPLIFKRVT